MTISQERENEPAACLAAVALAHDFGDRREEARCSWNSRVRIRPDGFPGFCNAMAMDVSLHGLALLVSQPLSVDSRVHIVYLHPRFGPSCVEGLVLHQKPGESGYHTGVQLDFRSQMDRVPYQELVTTMGQVL